MAKPRTPADPGRAGRPKKGEHVEKRVDMHVKVNPDFRRRFNKAASCAGQGATYEHKKALSDRLEILEAAANRAAEYATPFEDPPEVEDDPEEKAV